MHPSQVASSGLVELDSLVTGRFTLERAGEALESDLDPNSLKSIVYPNGYQEGDEGSSSANAERLLICVYVRTAHVPAATVARSQFWS